MTRTSNESLYHCLQTHRPTLEPLRNLAQVPRVGPGAISRFSILLASLEFAILTSHRGRRNVCATRAYLGVDRQALAQAGATLAVAMSHSNTPAEEDKSPLRIYRRNSACCECVWVASSPDIHERGHGDVQADERIDGTGRVPDECVPMKRTRGDVWGGIDVPQAARRLVPPCLDRSAGTMLG